MTSPTSTSFRVTEGDTGEDRVRVVGVLEAGVAARAMEKEPSDATGPLYLPPLKVTVTTWAGQEGRGGGVTPNGGHGSWGLGCALIRLGPVKISN